MKMNFIVIPETTTRVAVNAIVEYSIHKNTVTILAGTKFTGTGSRMTADALIYRVKFATEAVAKEYMDWLDCKLGAEYFYLHKNR